MGKRGQGFRDERMDVPLPDKEQRIYLVSLKVLLMSTEPI